MAPAEGHIWETRLALECGVGFRQSADVPSHSQQRKSQFLFASRKRASTRRQAVRPEAKIELSYTLALSRWAAMGKASSSLLVNFPKAFLTSVIRAARAASSACDTGPANGEPAT